MFKNVLVATDGSERAERAATYAIELAGSSEGKLHVLSVVNEDRPRTAGEIDRDFYEEIEDSPNIDVEKLDQERKKPEMGFANRIVQQASDKGVEAAMLVRVGNPAAEIVKAAVELGAEVIVIASHGRSAVGTTLMGSVASGVIHRGEIPVLVIPVHNES